MNFMCYVCLGKSLSLGRDLVIWRSYMYWKSSTGIYSWLGVRIRLKHNEKSVETSALVNSGFETDAPDIVIPVEVAKRLNLWPPKEVSFAIVDTGGEISTPYYESIVELELILPDKKTKKEIVNVIINPHIHEVLLSDYVSSILGIILLNIKKGLWRLSDDPIDTIRKSTELEEWWNS